MPKTKAFRKLERSVRKQYLGKPVPLRYRARYGKRYGARDVKSVSYAIARKMGITEGIGRPKLYSRGRNI